MKMTNPAVLERRKQQADYYRDRGKVNIEMDVELYKEFMNTCEANFDTPTEVLSAIMHDFITQCHKQEIDY